MEEKEGEYNNCTTILKNKSIFKRKNKIVFLHYPIFYFGHQI